MLWPYFSFYVNFMQLVWNEWTLHLKTGRKKRKERGKKEIWNEHQIIIFYIFVPNLEEGYLSYHS